jgi:hypothetical protein
VTINSDRINADEQVEAVRDESGLQVNDPPRAGAQYTLVNLSVTYVGPGSNGFEDYLFGALKAEGDKILDEPTCTPPQPVGSIDPLLSGRTDSGNLCYQIASDDATSLLLTGFAATGARTAHYPFTRPVWFALRQWRSRGRGFANAAALIPPDPAPGARPERRGRLAGSVATTGLTARSECGRLRRNRRGRIWSAGEAVLLFSAHGSIDWRGWGQP